MALEFKIIPVTPFEQNCSVIWCTETLMAAIVDPGGEIDKVHDFIKSNNLELDKILITHAHLDHAGGTAELARKTGVPIIGPHKDDQFWIDLMPQQCQQFGMQGETFSPDQWLNHNDSVSLGKLSFDVVHCPGAHSWSRGICGNITVICDGGRCVISRFYRPFRFPQRQPNRPHQFHSTTLVSIWR